MSTHTSPPPETPTLPTEADYASALAQRPVPYLAGRRRIPISWISNVFNVESIKTPSTSSGKGNGGGKKGGSGNSQKTYYSSIVGVLCHGPSDRVLAIEADANASVPTWSGTSGRSGDYVDLTPADSTDLLSGGKMRLYWGTETQTPSTLLSGHPNYPGYTMLHLSRFKMGDSRGTPRDVSVTLARLPVVDTSIVASESNQFSSDGQYQINPIAALAEIMLSPLGFNWPLSMLDSTSWLAESANLWTNRQEYAACSPFFDSFEEARNKFSDLVAMADVALRWMANGKLGLVRTLPGYIPSNAATFDARHFRDGAPIRPRGNGLSNLATRVQVDFYNTDTGNTPIMWKSDNVQRHDLWALQTMDYIPNPIKISRPYIGIVAQAQMHGDEALRRQAVPTLSAVAHMRSAEIAVATDGSPIQPGDKHYFDVDPQPGGSSLPSLAVVLGRTDFDDGTVDLELQFDASVAVVPQFPDWTGAQTETPPVAASIAHALIVPQFPIVTDPDSAVYILATRPNTNIHGLRAMFGVTNVGDFVELGSQDGFACRATLASNIDNSQTTVRLNITDGDTGPDGYIAGQTPENPTAAQSDVLLALMAQVDGNGAIVVSGGEPVMEFVSLVSRSAVSSGVYDYTVLRGRQDTVASAWTAASTVVWIVPQSHLVRWSLPVMDEEAGTGDTNWVKLASYTIGAEDAGTLPMFAVKFPAHPVSTGDVGFLDNDFDLCPAANDGSNPVLTNAITNMLVYDGDDNVTALWDFAATPSAGVTGSLGSGATKNRYTVTGFTTDNGYVDITASRTGHADVTARFVLAKVLGGGQAYWLIVSAAALQKSAGGVYTPSALVFSAITQNGTSTPIAYAGRFKVEETSDGSTWSTVYTSAADESTHSHTPSAGIKAVKCSLYQAGGTTTLFDYETTPVVNDGSPGDPGADGATGPEGPMGPEGPPGADAPTDAIDTANIVDGAVSAFSLDFSSGTMNTNNSGGGTMTLASIGITTTGQAVSLLASTAWTPLDNFTFTFTIACDGTDIWSGPLKSGQIGANYMPFPYAHTPAAGFHTYDFKVTWVSAFYQVTPFTNRFLQAVSLKK